MKLVSWVFAIKHLCEMPGNFKEIKFLGEQSMPYSSETLIFVITEAFLVFFFPEEIMELCPLSRVFILKLIFYCSIGGGGEKLLSKTEFSCLPG